MLHGCTTRLACQRLLKCATLASVLQVLLVASIFDARAALVHATLSPEMAVVQGDGASDPTDVASNSDAAYEEKRSWQSLQGPWGKRMAWSAEPSEADDEVYLAEHWPIPVLVTNAATLERLASQRQAAADALSGMTFNDDLLASMEDGMDGSSAILNEKRTWKNMNAAWGKRRQAPAWNKFSGAWGKREPGWNNLKGMWGKRASKDWQKLHSGWGKRSQSFAGFN